jgi:hypothetical protein
MGGKVSYYEVVIEYKSGGKTYVGPYFSKVDALNLVDGSVFGRESGYIADYSVRECKALQNYLVVSETIWPQIVGKYNSYAEAQYMKEQIKNNIGSAKIIDLRKRNAKKNQRTL